VFQNRLAIYDLLRKAGVTLSVTEEQQIKKVAKELLERLKSERLVLDWRKKQQARAAVRQLIEQMLDRLPSAFAPAVYEQACERAYLHVHDCHYGREKRDSIPPHGPPLGDLSASDDRLSATPSPHFLILTCPA
jgi:hypothetical protein